MYSSFCPHMASTIAFIVKTSYLKDILELMVEELVVYNLFITSKRSLLRGQSNDGGLIHLS